MAWKKIGEVGVDSGQLLVCDPCYIDSEWEQEKDETPLNKPEHSFSYGACCAKTLTDSKNGQLNYKLGHPGVGVVFSSGFGDGCYEVFAKYEDYGNLGKRIKEVKIVLITDKEIDIMDHLTK